MIASRFRTCELVLLALTVLAGAQCLATDYYVDAESGSNENSGLAPSRAFRTITYALEAIRLHNATPATINLAAGVYSPDTNGEAFPLNMTSSTSLLGEGRSSTILSWPGPDTDAIGCHNVSDIRIESFSIVKYQDSESGIGCGIDIIACKGHFSIIRCDIEPI